MNRVSDGIQIEKNQVFEMILQQIHEHFKNERFA